MGDDDGFRMFAAARHGSLVRAAVLLGCSRPDAEDAAQDALARCFVAWTRVRAADDPEAYAYRVLVNGITRARRRRWHGELPHAELPEPPAGADPEQDFVVRDAVHAALRRLSPAHRQVLVLRYFADLSEQRTAAVLGIPVGTVKSRCGRAAALLAADGVLVEQVTTTLPESS